MKCFMGEQEDFECDAVWDGEPVKILKDRGDMIPRMGTGEEACGGVLDVLKFVEKICGCAIQDAVTVIDA